MLLGSVIVFARQRASDFVIGRLAGAQSLGLYNIGAELSTMPATEIAMPVSRAAFPVYSAIARDRGGLADAYHRVLGLVALIAIPAGVGLAVTADLLVPLLFGPNWIAAIPIAGLLGFYGVTLAVQGNVFPLFLAVGRPQLSVWVVAFQLACLLPMLFVFTDRDGIAGAATAYLASGILSMPLAMYLAARELDVGMLRSVRVLWRPVAASAAMYMALDRLRPSLDSGAGAGAMGSHLLAAVSAGAVFFVFVSVTLWLLAGRPDGAERHVLDYCRRRARLWAGRAA
jgi:O-antigen/teichoic acid export membrane protein